MSSSSSSAVRSSASAPRKRSRRDSAAAADDDAPRSRPMHGHRDADEDELVQDDSEFLMQPPTRPSAKPSKARADASASLGISDFLSGLAAPDPFASLPPPPSSTSSSFSITRPDHPTLLYERVQDRLAMKRFARQQEREREGLPADDDDEAADAAAEGGEHEGEDEDEDDQEGVEEDDGEEDNGEDHLTQDDVADEDNDGDEVDEEEDEGDAEQKAVAAERVEAKPARTASADSSASSPSSSTSAVRGVRVVDWQGDVAALRLIRDFSQLRLSKPLIRAITDLGWSSPTPVQSAVIPHATAGRDVLANAATGSGKSAAFILPMLERLLFRPNRRTALTRCLVLLPTRELARQCFDMTEALARHTDIRAALIVGGMSSQAQEAALRTRPDILLATPGRLIDHLRNTASVHLEDIEVLVLDEADRLLELGFHDELKEIIRLSPRQRQTLLFSATLSPSVSDLILLSCKQPIRVTIDPYDSVVERLSQEFIRIKQRASEEDEQREREAILLALCQRSFRERVLLFTRTKEECHRLFLLLSFHQIKAAELQGNLTQQQRMEALDLFKAGKVSHLVCTDLASRGLDIPAISTVLQSSMPTQLRLYIHRVGRTARAGKAGRAVTLVGFHERKTLKALMKKSSDVVHARQVPTEVVAKYRQSVAAVEDDVAAVLDSEKMDKAERVAEMELNKARNAMLHAQEIHSRPAKTWFQTQQEKLTSKAVSVQAFPRRGEEGEEKQREAGKEEEGKEADDEGEEGKGEGRGMHLDRKKKVDPLRGLSRAQKRRKLMRMQAEREAADRLRAARSEDPSVSADDVRVQDPVSEAVHAAKAVKRKQLRGQQPTREGGDRGGAASAIKRGAKAQKRKRSDGQGEGAEGGGAKRRVLLMDEEGPDRRYKVRKTEARAQAAAPKKPKPAKGRKAFKSKGKHKRRR